MVALLLAALCCGATATINPAEWDWSIKLDPSIGFEAYFSMDAGDDTVTVALTAQHTGWLGLGIAEPTSGHMKGSDIVTVSVDDAGGVSAVDSHVEWAATPYPGVPSMWPAPDDVQDWTIVSGSQDGDTMTVIISRQLCTGDKQDRDIVTDGINRLIWAWGDGDSVGYHGSNRGSAVANFKGGPVIPAHDHMITYTFDNYTIPAQRTTYSCQSFILPNDQKRHVVAIEPVLHGPTKKYAHHALLHICENNPYFTNHLNPKKCSTDGSQEMDSAEGASPLGISNSQCSSLMWVWATGGDTFVLPDNVGFPIGPNKADSVYVILEMHYDNPDHVEGLQDFSGFNIYLSDTLREHDAGILTTGDPLVSFATIPQGEEAAHYEGACPGACTQEFSTDLQVFAVFSHMHSYGRIIYTTVNDADGSFKTLANRVDYWDAGYQVITKADFKISPGDSLHTHCYFDTSLASADVPFGTGSEQEMCMDFLIYYPRQFHGVDAAGDPARLAYCGAFELASIGLSGTATLCGSLANPGQDFLLADPTLQTVEGLSRFADPLDFGAMGTRDCNPGGGGGDGAPQCKDRVGDLLYYAPANMLLTETCDTSMGDDCSAPLDTKALWGWEIPGRTFWSRGTKSPDLEACKA